MLCLFRYLHHNFIKNRLEMAGPKIYLLIQRLLIVCLRTLPNMPTLRRLITRSKQMQLTLFSKSQFRIDVKTAVNDMHKISTQDIMQKLYESVTE